MITTNAAAVAATRARLAEVMRAMDIEPSDILNVTALLSQCGRRVLVMVKLAGATELFGEEAPFCLECDLPQPIERSAFDDAAFVQQLLLTGPPRGTALH